MRSDTPLNCPLCGATESVWAHLGATTCLRCGATDLDAAAHAAIADRDEPTRPLSIPGRAYLRARGVTNESIAAFDIRSDAAGRIVFPIHSSTGHRIIAWARRPIHPEPGAPKYRNSPETTDYKKRLTLYNLHRAMPAMRATGTAILCEGYFDVIQIWQAGAQHVVACCGTAFTMDQALLLRRHCSRVQLAFDSDTAGLNATDRAHRILADLSFDVDQILFDGDPDDHLRAGKGWPEVRVLHRAPRIGSLGELFDRVEALAG